jgi:hypothetical protein
LTRKATAVLAIEPAACGGARSAREHGVDARLELYASDGRLFHLFGQFLLEAAEAFAHAGRFV